MHSPGNSRKNDWGRIHCRLWWTEGWMNTLKTNIVEKALIDIVYQRRLDTIPLWIVDKLAKSTCLTDAMTKRIFGNMSFLPIAANVKKHAGRTFRDVHFQKALEEQLINLRRFRSYRPAGCQCQQSLSPPYLNRQICQHIHISTTNSRRKTARGIAEVAK